MKSSGGNSDNSRNV